jgi:hypothetical protein
MSAKRADVQPANLLMSQQALMGFGIGLVVFLPLSSLIGKFAILWIGRIRVSFIRVLISTSVAYLAAWALAWLISLLGAETPESKGLRLIVGCGILAAFHLNLSRSPTGERMSSLQAIFAALLQGIGSVVAFLLILLLGMALKKAFA